MRPSLGGIVRAVRRRLGPPLPTYQLRPAAEVFDVWARDGRGDGMERAHGPVVRRILDRLELAPDTRFLDIGCGNGYAVRWAAARITAGVAIGLDASEEMVAQARTLSEGLTNVSFHCTSFPHHVLSASSFDVIFSMETMYYMTDIEQALREALILLKPGGSFISAVDFYRENRASRGWAGYVGTDMKLMSGRGWRRAFQRAGFEAVSQWRLVIPESQAKEPWHATVGSLVTRGRRR